MEAALFHATVSDNNISLKEKFSKDTGEEFWKINFDTDKKWHFIYVGKPKRINIAL